MHLRQAKYSQSIVYCSTEDTFLRDFYMTLSLTLSKSDVQKTNDKIIQMTGGTCFGSSLMQCTLIEFADFLSGGFTKIIQMIERTFF